MIIKELDPFDSEDKFAKAGRAAEEQMAFYLKRFFANDPDFLVLNSIRLESDGDAAQVDHLIIHSHGLAIVESKSVHGKIQIKDDGQWIRWFNGNQSKGMASPITQARLQQRFFRDVLGKASNNQDLFNKINFDIFIAISDSGVILWPQSGVVEGVCKADQIADRVIQRRDELSKASPTALLSQGNREKIATFLKAKHSPLVKQVPILDAEDDIQPTASEQAPSETAPSQTALQCSHCHSQNMEVRYAYNYFGYCRDCEKNTPIKPACPACGSAAKLRKAKQEFYVDCGACGQSTLFHVNK
ncbi:NERD domain-containing protein [Ralstonia sp. RL]|uniref:NERD domain-containing protein n=1 Tax=Ralstonia sp. RL TaxID=1839756 RepID=UPI00257A34F6|nr:NERD domain-containing protein [Ralstonia sp. RL]